MLVQYLILVILKTWSFLEKVQILSFKSFYRLAQRNISTELSVWNIYVNQNKSLKEHECINIVNSISGRIKVIHKLATTDERKEINPKDTSGLR